MERDSLTVGILVDEPAMERWAADAVAEAIESANVSVAQVILPAGAGEDDSSGSLRRYASSALEEGAWAPVLAMHRLVNTPTYLEKVPLEDLDWFDDAEVIRVRPEPADGIGQRLPDAAIDRIEAASIDLLFRRGFGILQGEVLTTPTYGVLSFHHGNIREYRGKPPGVWEFANDERTAGITLQRLTSTLDGGEIVVEKTVAIEGLETWQAIERRLFERSTDMLATACERLREAEFDATTANDLGPLYTCPGVADTVRIALKNIRGMMSNRSS